MVISPAGRLDTGPQDVRRVSRKPVLVTRSGWLLATRPKILPAMSRTRNVLRAVGLSAAAVLVTVTAGASCIYPDTNIRIMRDGFKWCANAEGAVGWNTPGNNHQILDPNQNVIQGCDCFDDEENAMLEDWDANGAPTMGDSDYSDYIVIRDKILTKAREKCNDRAEALDYSYNNCIAAIPDTDDIFPNGTSGACKYEELVSDSDGTDTDESPPAPFDLSGLSCRSGSCRAPQGLIDDMIARPEAFMLDDTRIQIDSSGLLSFTNVSPGDVAYTVGIRSGDKLLKINGQDATSIEVVAELLVGLDRARSATIEIKDAYGSVVTLSASVY